MKILILNGSPKGKYSITLQTTRYLENVYPRHTFEVFNVGQKAKSLERALEVPIPEDVYARLQKEMEGTHGG